MGVVGVGTSLATRVWDPLWNPFRPNPEKVLAKTASQMKELKTYHNKTVFVADFKNKEGFKIEGDFSGDSDNADGNNPKLAGKFNLNFLLWKERNFL